MIIRLFTFGFIVTGEAAILSFPALGRLNNRLIANWTNHKTLPSALPYFSGQEGQLRETAFSPRLITPVLSCVDIILYLKLNLLF